jgi:hypothetical protein
VQRSAGVEQAARRLYDRFSGNDVDAFTAGPTEWSEGREAWIAAIPGVRLEAGSPRGWEEGAAGWVADRPTFVLPAGTAIPVRLTAVFVREGSEWKPVQAHCSLGVPDEAMMTVLGGGQG